MLADFASAYGQKYIALRYLNAAGTDPQARIDERHDPETHLILLALQAITGKHPPLQLSRQDYDTPDGTCIRDHIHVDDLANASILAIHYLNNGGGSRVFNLGSNHGCSVNGSSRLQHKYMSIRTTDLRAKTLWRPSNLGCRCIAC